MLKKISFLVLAAVMIVSVAHAAKGAIEGTVEKMDKHSITVKVGSDVKTFTFEKGMKVTVNGKKPRALTVKPGDKVELVANKNNVVQKMDLKPQTTSENSGSN